MTNSIYIHPPSVTVGMLKNDVGEISNCLREIYKQPNFPDIEFIKNSGLEYVPFLENDALGALSSILENSEAIDISNIILAVDAYAEDGFGSRFCDVYKIGFSSHQDVVEFRSDQRCVLHDRTSKLSVYIDYGDFSSIVAPPELLEHCGLHNNIDRIDSLERDINSMEIEGFVSFYSQLISLTRSQYK